MDILLTSYGRTALYLALKASNVYNKEVLVPSFTCFTTVVPAILMAGGKPVFVDISIEDLSMDIEDLLKKITNNTRVILTTCYYGFYNVDYFKTIDELCKEKSIIHINDNTHCFNFNLIHKFYGDIGVFSFSKTIPSPGGGFVVFKNSEIYLNAIEIQKKEKNLFHNFAINAIAKKYFFHLSRDKYYKNIGKSFFDDLLYLWSKILIKFKLYNEGLFYRINDDNYKYYMNKVFYGKIDTRMTPYQRSIILKNLLFYPFLLAKRQFYAKELDKIIKSFFPLEDNNLYQYVIYSEKSTFLEKTFKKLGVRTRRCWPYHQRYPKQMLTRNVLLLKNNLLLIDLENLNKTKIILLKKELTK